MKCPACNETLEWLARASTELRMTIYWCSNLDCQLYGVLRIDPDVV